MQLTSEIYTAICYRCDPLRCDELALISLPNPTADPASRALPASSSTSSPVTPRAPVGEEPDGGVSAGDAGGALGIGGVAMGDVSGVCADLSSGTGAGMGLVRSNCMPSTNTCSLFGEVERCELSAMRLCKPSPFSVRLLSIE